MMIPSKELVQALETVSEIIESGYYYDPVSREKLIWNPQNEVRCQFYFLVKLLGFNTSMRFCPSGYWYEFLQRENIALERKKDLRDQLIQFLEEKGIEKEDYKDLELCGTDELKEELSYHERQMHMAAWYKQKAHVLRQELLLQKAKKAHVLRQELLLQKERSDVSQRAIKIKKQKDKETVKVPVRIV